MGAIERITSFFKRSVNRYKAGSIEPRDIPSESDIEEYFKEIDSMCPGVGAVGIIVLDENGDEKTVAMIERPDEWQPR